MYSVILLLFLLVLLGTGGSLVFSRFLSRDARYRRRLKKRNEEDWKAERLRQERLLEARMQEIHGKELGWRDASIPGKSFDRSWTAAREELLDIRDEV